jgi:hypothetical protein
MCDEVQSNRTIKSKYTLPEHARQLVVWVIPIRRLLQEPAAWSRRKWRGLADSVFIDQR